METISINCSLGDIPNNFFIPNTSSFFVVMNPMMFHDLCCTNMVYRITGNFWGVGRLREECWFIFLEICHCFTHWNCLCFTHCLLMVVWGDVIALSRNFFFQGITLPQLGKGLI
uniref:Uncharacterized protein n=1 Tax=Bovine herpesvirus 4 TaxID=10385 RepID=A0A858PWR1_BHV4|nr:hypothetical protein [Bovine gammaherpesvirus 4]